MLEALNNDKTIYAKYANKFKGEYHCPECNEIVILKLPHIPLGAPGYKCPHFSHLKETSCVDRVTSSESIRHIEFKNELYLRLSDKYGERNVEMEKRFSGCRPDIWLNQVNCGIALEIQISSIDKEAMEIRTKAHLANNLYSCWLFPESFAKINTDIKYHIEVVAKWNYNIAFLLTDDFLIKPVKLIPIKNHRGFSVSHRFDLLYGDTFDITDLENYAVLRDIEDDLKYKQFKKKIVSLKYGYEISKKY